MLKFFGIRGEMGRIDYFKSYVFRLLIAVVIVLLISLVDPSISVADWFNFPDSKEATINNWEEYLAYQSDPAVYINELKRGFINLILYISIDCRRANDIGMSYGWIAPGWFMFLLPGIIFANPIGFAVSFLLYVYIGVVNLILVFKPGKTHKQFVRSKQASKV